VYQKGLITAIPNEPFFEEMSPRRHSDAFGTFPRFFEKIRVSNELRELGKAETCKALRLRGVYARAIQSGMIQAGDEVRKVGYDFGAFHFS
jgi:hypothetical protein